jgi:hypothetical protein
VWVLLFIGERACDFLNQYAPGYYPGRYSGAIYRDDPELQLPRKVGRGNVLADCALTGLALGTIAGAFILLRVSIVSILRAYLIILTGSLAFAVVGALLGYGLGAIIPGYYRGAFRAGSEPWFEPREVGMGLGLTQGLIAGLAVGAVVVVAVTWYRARIRSSEQGPARE